MDTMAEKDRVEGTPVAIARKLLVEYRAMRPAKPDDQLNEAIVAFRRAGVSVGLGVASLAEIAQAWGLATTTDSLLRRYSPLLGPPIEELKVNEPTGPVGLEELLNAKISRQYALIPWPFPALTERSASLLPGSVTVLCGSPGGAKSWFILSCLRHWTTIGVCPVAVLMLEETKEWYLNRLLSLIEGDTNYLDCEWVATHSEQTLSVYKKNLTQINEIIGPDLHCFGDRTLSQCADWVEFQCKAGKRIIVIDPITLASPGNEKPWDADRNFLNRVKVYIEKYGASLVLVSHPRKGTGAGVKSGPPTMDDLAGGAVISRAAASVLWLNSSPPGTVLPIQSQGAVTLQSVHKTITIMKARNSSGCGDRIGFTFSRITFSEVGLIGSANTEEPKPEKTKTPRGVKMKSKPTQEPNEESPF